MALLFTACMRDSVPRRLELFIEPMGAKMALNGTNGTWSAGDSVMVNGQTVAINYSGEQAYIANVTSADVYRAFYPTTLAQGAGNSDAVTVTLPREYSYRTDAHGQLLPLPMAARSTGDNLQFKHLTGAICFTLKNERTDHPVTIDRITVSSSTYQLSGNREIDLTAVATLGPQATAVAADRQVDITFTHQSLVIAVGDSQQVVVPVAPVGADNRFTVTVTSHYQGIRHVYTKTQTTGGALARNQMAYAKIELNNQMVNYSLFNGNGTENSPYTISTPTDFLLMAEAISSQWNDLYSQNYKSLHYSITNDINLDGHSVYPIRNFRSGSINGNGHIIKNLTVLGHEGNGEDTCALFQSVYNASIQDLTLDHFTLSNNSNSNKLYLGGFFGEIISTSLSSCSVTNLQFDVTVANNNTSIIGGIAAYARRNNTISDCIVSFSPVFTFSPQTIHFGNIIGRLADGTSSEHNITLTKCNATNPSISIQSSSQINFGGMIGFLNKEQLVLNKCNYTGTGNDVNPRSLTSTTIRAGGLVGYYNTTNSPYSLSISNCNVSGNIITNATTNYTGSYVGHCTGWNYINLDENTCSSSLTFSSAAK